MYFLNTKLRRLFTKALANAKAVKRLTRNNQPNGFTLAELLVSLFIIAIISGIFLANYRSAGKRSEMVNAVHLAVSDIRVCQSYSVGSRLYGSAVPSGGWGIYFDTTSNINNKYIIFADVNGNKQYDAGSEANEANGAKIIFLPAKVKIFSIYYDGLPVTNASIVFLPPDPQTLINGAQNGSVVITFREDVNSSVSTIEINPYGLVDANN